VVSTESESLIGAAAKNQVSKEPSNTVFDPERLISREFESTVQSEVKHRSFKVVAVKEDKPVIEVQSVQGREQAVLA